MTKIPRKDIGASVRARLLRLARERGDDFQLMLTRYVNERFLYRLASSRHAVSERPRLREQRPDRAGYVMVEDRHAIV